MKSSVVTIVLMAALSSCASIVNEPRVRLTVYTDKPTDITVEGRQLHVDRKRKITVTRQNSPLTITAKQDSLTKEFVLPPKNSFMYHMNILSWGIGYAFDKGDKRYTYQASSFLGFGSDDKKPRRFVPSSSRQKNLVISIPWVNSIYLHQPDRSNTGFLGIAIGYDHYYSKYKFISISGGVVTDFPMPFPAPLDRIGEYETMNSSYVSLTDNFRLNRFSIGYGINYAENNWRLFTRSDVMEPSEVIDHYKSSGVGITLTSYYQLSPSFHMGIIYRPTLWSVYPESEFNYEHVISLDLAWRIRLTK